MKRLQFIAALFSAPAVMSAHCKSTIRTTPCKPPFKRGDRVKVMREKKHQWDDKIKCEAIVVEPHKFANPGKEAYELLLLTEKPYSMAWFEADEVEGLPGTKEEGWRLLEKYESK